jgi:hypothetical protein
MVARLAGTMDGGEMKGVGSVLQRLLGKDPADTAEVPEWGIASGAVGEL